METKNIDYNQVESLYETCSDGRGPREFCKDAGINYDSYINWRRKEFVAKKKGVMTPFIMIPVEITDAPAETTSDNESSKTCQVNDANTILFVEIKFSEGLSLRRYNMEVNDLIGLLAKISAALC